MLLIWGLCVVFKKSSFFLQHPFFQACTELGGTWVQKHQTNDHHVYLPGNFQERSMNRLL